MKVENIRISNFENALRGMRNPMNSWDKIDSAFGIGSEEWTEADWAVAEAWVMKDGLSIDSEGYDEAIEKYDAWLIKNGVIHKDENSNCFEYAFIGPNDMDLAQRLIKAGPEHCKFLRQIFVSMDITAPLYWWKEFDTYKIGTTANSTSTMHKLTSKPITIDCFEADDFVNICYPNERDDFIKTELIPYLEFLRLKYLETKDNKYWKELVRWLPNGWLQTRTWTGSYANLRNMRHQRKGHKLTEWHFICDTIDTLPYAEEFINCK